MRILFIHQNFPAQFGAIGVHLAALGWDVTFATAREEAQPPNGTRMFKFKASREPAEETHRYLQGTEQALLNGQGFARSALQIAAKGYRPDVIVAHSGWGSGTFAKAIWPDVPLVTYIEWYYRYPLVDRIGPPPKKELPAEERARLLVRNTPFLLDHHQSDAVHCPTYFQAEQFPEHIRETMTVIHDGVDCVSNVPAPGTRLDLPGVELPDDAELLTYATRSMEPHRGFPEFMRALARVQAKRPRLHTVIAGEDRVAYGAKLKEGDSWKARMLKELDLDQSRLHFVGLLPRPQFRNLLQSTQLHVYFTVPFVLSWSLIEAMACGTPILSSDVPPVREALKDGVSARLLDHTNVNAIAKSINALLDDEETRKRYAAEARRTAVQRYDARWIYPAKAEMFRELAERHAASTK